MNVLKYSDAVNTDCYAEGLAVCGIQGACPRLQAVTWVRNRTLDLLISDPLPYQLGDRFTLRRQEWVPMLLSRKVLNF